MRSVINVDDEGQRKVEVRPDLPFPLFFGSLGSMRPGTWYAWIVFRLSPKQPLGYMTHHEVLTSLLDETLSRRDAVFLGRHGESYSALLCLHAATHPNIEHQAAQIADEMIRRCFDILKMELYCGISTFSTSIGEVPLLFREAELASQSFFFNEANLTFFHQAPRKKSFSRTEWVGFFNNVKQFITEHHFEGLKLWLDQQFQSMADRVLPKEAIRLCEMVTMIVVHYILERYQVDIRDQDERAGGPDLHDFRDAASWRQLQDMARAMIQKAQFVIERKRTERGWIAETIAFIESNYDKPLRLEDVAGHVNFSGNYFSQRFHQETGVSFTDYLMKYRIDKAKEHFLIGNESTEEIASKVGYSNTNYFTRVFKKVTGMTLSEFKQKKLNVNR